MEYTDERRPEEQRVKKYVHTIMINLPNAIHDKLRYKALSEGYSVTKAIQQLIENYISE